MTEVVDFSEQSVRIYAAINEAAQQGLPAPRIFETPAQEIRRLLEFIYAIDPARPTKEGLAETGAGMASGSDALERMQAKYPEFAGIQPMTGTASRSPAARAGPVADIMAGLNAVSGAVNEAPKALPAEPKPDTSRMLTDHSSHGAHNNHATIGNKRVLIETMPRRTLHSNSGTDDDAEASNEGAPARRRAPQMLTEAM